MGDLHATRLAFDRIWGHPFQTKGFVQSGNDSKMPLPQLFVWMPIVLIKVNPFLSAFKFTLTNSGLDGYPLLAILVVG